MLRCRNGNGEGQTGRVGLRCDRLVARRQRGTNENTNGLLRQYFSKALTSIGTALATLLLSRPHSTADRGRRSVGEPHPKPSTNCYSHTSEDVLRRPLETGQCLSMRYTERLADARIEPSVGQPWGLV